jgi:uncharacterized membrane protein YeaQ/YmgE (transglycosylase-associated protein family)
MAYSCPYELYIANAKRLVQIRYKAWRFLIAFLIVLIFIPLNGVCIRAYMAIYRGIYRPHGSSNEVYMGAYMGHMGAAMGHACAHIWAIWEQHWGMYARIHGPHGSSIGAYMRAYMAIYRSINGAYMRNRACIRAYMAIYGGIYGPHGSSNGAYIRAYMAIYGSINGACMRAYMGHMGAVMGHACAHTWAIYGGSNGACMRAYMAIYGSPIGRVGRKGIVGNPFPTLFRSVYPSRG